MKHIYPDYYGSFHCIAGACPDTCCQAWDVEIDPDTAAFYRGLDGPMGDVLRENLYEEDGCIYLANHQGKCPMLDENGLCGVQCAWGPEALSKVCTEFPRIVQDYGSFAEHGLELSCPEAARLILTGGSWIPPETELSEDGDYDMELMQLLCRTRPEGFALLEDRRFSVPERLALLLLWGHRVQSAIDTGEYEPVDPKAALDALDNAVGPGSPGLILEEFGSLEILTDRWKTMLDTPVSGFFWPEELLNIARYGLYRYFYQAVSDCDAVSRIKFVVTFCIVAAAMSRDLPGLISCAQTFSKEIENDADNMDALLDGAYSMHGLTDVNLLGILLHA